MGVAGGVFLPLDVSSGPATHISKSKWRNIWMLDVFCYRIPAPYGPNQNTPRIQICNKEV